ncbi:hypothetical protein RRG08_009113 [Elysia crispata]|uniref:Uncharacterized protein n=1 Tax=Elysia crispata TaxID=231223 RepID=A0AAE1D223_9GAST|nr:hypothetical protein RRG08_009113 [Elysia crispata]
MSLDKTASTSLVLSSRPLRNREGVKGFDVAVVVMKEMIVEAMRVVVVVLLLVVEFNSVNNGSDPKRVFSPPDALHFESVARLRSPQEQSSCWEEFSFLFGQRVHSSS